MKKVNLKELKELNYKTDKCILFYELDEYGNIDSEIHIINDTGHNGWNGEISLIPDENNIEKFEAFSVDSSDIDYDENQKFLVLNEDEIKEIINILKEFCL